MIVNMHPGEHPVGSNVAPGKAPTCSSRWLSLLERPTWPCLRDTVVQYRVAKYLTVSQWSARQALEVKDGAVSMTRLTGGLRGGESWGLFQFGGCYFRSFFFLLGYKNGTVLSDLIIIDSSWYHVVIVSRT